MSATNRGAVRNEADFYPTPPSAVWALLDRIGGTLESSGLNQRGYWLLCFAAVFMGAG